MSFVTLISVFFILTCRMYILKKNNETVIRPIEILAQIINEKPELLLSTSNSRLPTIATLRVTAILSGARRSHRSLE